MKHTHLHDGYNWVGVGGWVVSGARIQMGQSLLRMAD
jgi:hypothetical protein